MLRETSIDTSSLSATNGIALHVDTRQQAGVLTICDLFSCCRLNSDLCIPQPQATCIRIMTVWMVTSSYIKVSDKLDLQGSKGVSHRRDDDEAVICTVCFEDATSHVQSVEVR